MESVSLVDLGPVIAAVLGPMLAFVVVSMRYQHLDGVKTRELIERSSKETLEKAGELIERSVGGIERSVGSLGDELGEHKRETKESFKDIRAILKEVTRSLADARERLARIEGHLGIGAPRHGETGEIAGDAA